MVFDFFYKILVFKSLEISKMFFHQITQTSNLQNILTIWNLVDTDEPLL